MKDFFPLITHVFETWVTKKTDKKSWTNKEMENKQPEK